jgi:kumamolisin
MIERRWTPSALEILDELFIAAALVGVSVFVASGDNAAEVDERGNAHVNAPASSPFVIACGATTLKRETDGTTHEIAWHRSGGGFGRAEVPPWQTAAGDWAAKNGLRPGRGVPDVAAQCVPGYPVFFDRKELAMHGTSATAPFWAALAARINEATTHRYGPGATIGFFAPILYDRAGELMKPIVRGRNATFEAGHGWNPLSGLGIPNGKALEATFLRNG